MIYNLKDQLSRKRFSTREKALWDAGAVVELTDKRRRTGSQNAYLHCATKALEVHHLTYDNHGDELHHLEDLTCICRKCHENLHSK